MSKKERESFSSIIRFASSRKDGRRIKRGGPSTYEKWLVRGSIPRWWFAGLNIPSLVSSYREREEREGRTRKRKRSEKDKTSK